MGTKKCIRCDLKLDLSNFSLADSKSGRLKNTCKSCTAKYIKAYWLSRRYNMGVEDLKLLVEKQNGLCAICQRDCALVIDHDHTTGIVRGLLCSPCNIAIGLFGDSEQNLHNAIGYLNG